MKIKIIDSFIAFLGVVICLFQVYLISTRIDFLPWGDSEAYFIWGLMVYVLFLPALLILGLLRLLINRKKISLLNSFSFFVAALFSLIPLGDDYASTFINCLSIVSLGAISIGVFYERLMVYKQAKLKDDNKLDIEDHLLT